MLLYNKKLKGYSKQLRKRHAQRRKIVLVKSKEKTVAGLSVLQTEDHRQLHIVDFYCPKAKLVIEIDGGQHYDDKEIKKDNVRDDYMREQRLTVLRFSDREVFENLNGV